MKGIPSFHNLWIFSRKSSGLLRGAYGILGLAHEAAEGFGELGGGHACDSTCVRVLSCPRLFSWFPPMARFPPNCLVQLAGLDQHAMREHIRHMAHHDALTGLPNRILLHDRLQNAVAQARRRGEALALLFIDLDDFKDVNDTLGHFAGDDLLIAVAKRITACIRETDTCARLGGDEFAVVQVGAHGAGEADLLCQRLIEAIDEPFQIHDQEVVIGTSIGVSLFPRDGVQVEQLLKNADLALYQAKSSGRRRYRLFQEELNVQLQLQKTLDENSGTRCSASSSFCTINRRSRLLVGDWWASRPWSVGIIRIGATRAGQVHSDRRGRD